MRDRRHRIRKRIGVVLAVSLSFVLLAALLAPAAVAQEGEPVTITVWGGWGTFKDTLVKIIDVFEKEHPDIRVETHEIVGDMDALIVQILGGTAPDIYMVRAEAMGGFIHEGLVLDLTPYFERDIDLDDFLPAWGSMYRNGRYYGVPSEGGGYRTDAMYVNRDIFAKAGMEPPGPNIEDALTYEEWIETARRLTIDVDGDGEPEQWGTHFRTTRWYHFLPSNGVTLFTEDYSDTMIDTPEAIEVLDVLQKLHHTYRVSAPNSYWFESQGNVAMNILWRSRLAVAEENIAGRFDWSVAPLPAGRAGSVGLTSMNPFAINPFSRNPEAAWTFLRFVLSEPAQRIIAEEGRATVLRSVALSPEFMLTDGPPYSIMPFIGGQAVDATLFQEPSGVTRPAAINQALNQLWQGEIAPRTAAEQMAAAWRAVLPKE